jgi:hypothetical protein
MIALQDIPYDENYRIYQLDKYLIRYPVSMKPICFEEEWYYGIIFQVGRTRYEIIHNYAMDTQRLLITEGSSIGASGWNDIPFKSATFSLLPKEIIVEEMFGSSLDGTILQEDDNE